VVAVVAAVAAVANIAPPSVFDVAEGWHALRYDLAGAAAALQAQGVEAVDRTGEPPIEVRVNVPAEGLLLRRIDRFLVDPRGIATPTGWTGGVILAVAPGETAPALAAAPMSLGHKVFMAAGGIALAVLAWQALTGDE
jgi:hypothetical protein